MACLGAAERGPTRLPNFQWGAAPPKPPGLAARSRAWVLSLGY